MNQSVGAGDIRVVLVDDHPVVRAGTRAILAGAPGIAVVGAAGSGGEALRLVADLLPDVLVLDLHLPDIGGLDVAMRVVAGFPTTAVLVLTIDDDPGHVVALARAGVHGYLTKGAADDEIAGAVRALARGARLPFSAPAQGRSGAALPRFTAREREVLDLLVAGRSNGEIAHALGIAERTVEHHVGNIFIKLGTASRAEAIGVVYGLGLVGAGRERAAVRPGS